MSVPTLVMLLKNMIAGTARVSNVIEKYEGAGREQSTSFQIQRVFFLNGKKFNLIVNWLSNSNSCNLLEC